MKIIVLKNLRVKQRYHIKQNITISLLDIYINNSSDNRIIDGILMYNKSSVQSTVLGLPNGIVYLLVTYTNVPQSYCWIISCWLWCFLRVFPSYINWFWLTLENTMLTYSEFLKLTNDRIHMCAQDVFVVTLPKWWYDGCDRVAGIRLGCNSSNAFIHVYGSILIFEHIAHIVWEWLYQLNLHLFHMPFRKNGRDKYHLAIFKIK